MKQKGTFMVPTDMDEQELTTYLKRAGAPPSPEFAQFMESEHERLRRAIKAGVKIAAGSDMYINMGTPQGYAAKRVLFAYKETGIDPLKILTFATKNAADLIGDPRLGVVKPQAFADIIAIDGDPAADFTAIERVKFVMKNGTVYMGPQ